MNWFRKVLFIGVNVLLLSSCDGNDQFKELNEFVSELKQAEANKPAKPVKASTKPLPTPPTYLGDTLRSPFLDNETQVKSKGPSSSPLQAYPLTTLRFTGTVTRANNTSIAFILTPDNMIYEVKEGGAIGDQNGKVISIKPDRIILIEQDPENTNQPKRTITLKLKDIH